MRDPLVHIGYHKTGSTWIQERVFSDPRFGFVKQPNPVPIDEAFIAQNPFTFDAADSRAAFAELFALAEERGLVPVLSHERLSGDIGSGGIDSRMIADRLAEAIPNARILIVIREQREMILSVYKTEVSYETFTIEDRFRDRTVMERRTPQPSLDYFQYHHLIAYYQKLFGRERVLVLPYEQLRADPGTFLSRIASFVDLAPPAVVPEDEVNVSLPAGLLALLRYVNVLLNAPGLRRIFQGPLEERLAKRVVLKAVNRIGRRFPKRLSRGVDRRWRRTVEELVDDRFVESNRITEEITGLDLGALGYMTRPTGS